MVTKRKMKIALVALPNPQLIHPEAHFPIGLLYVGGSLKRAGYEVQVVDLRGKKGITESDIPEVDIIGITATSGEINFAMQVNEIAHLKGARTMIGGAHATFMPETCKEFDIVVKGDGELAVTDALSNFTWKYFERPLKDLSGYFPDWDLVGERGFSRELFMGEGYGQGPLCAGVITSRGCPFACSYCRTVPEKVRYRPLEDIYLELSQLISKGITHLRFYDECMSLNRKRALELFLMFKELGIRWRAHTRSDLFDDELAKAAKEAGCEEMGFGFEAVSNHVLEAVRKKETVEQHKRAVRICKRWGIKCKAFWMTSLPQQGWKEIEDIKKFMIDEGPDRWIVSNFCAYPGSDVWQSPEQYGVTWLEKDLSKYWNFSDEALVEYKTISKEELKALYHDLKSWLEVNFVRGR